jgi:DNA-binding LacI/PurR family transcriptional regulator
VGWHRRWGHYEYLQAITIPLMDHGRPFRIHYFDASDPNLEGLRRALAGDAFSGIITFDVQTRPQVEALATMPVPTVLMDSVTYGVPVNLVQAANSEGVCDATLHLLRTTDGGPLAYLVPEVWKNCEGSPHRERYLGFLEAHRRMGMEVTDDMLVPCRVIFRDAVVATDRILQRVPRFRGIVCNDDDVAQGVLYRLKELGVSVPGEMSVFGFGGYPVSDICMMPTLSTVNVDIAACGREAVDLLERIIREPLREPETVRVPTQLVIRQSTAPRIAMQALHVNSKQLSHTGTEARA